MKKIPKLQTAFLPLIYNRELNMATSLPVDRTYNVRFPYNINVTKKRTHFASKSPRTSRRAQNVLPYYINAGDLVGAALGPMNLASPGQHYRAFKETDNITDHFRSVVRGNSGWTSELFAKEHPVLSLSSNLVGDAISGAAIAKAPGALNTLIRMDMPRYGFTPTTKYIFNPNLVGSNGVGITPVNKIFDPERWFRFRDPKYVTEQDKKVLTEHLPEYKLILEKALDEGNYMLTFKGFPNSIRTEDGRYVFLGDEGSWILSLSKDFLTKFKDKTLKIGYKGGTDLKAIEGGVQEHAPETFPELDKGIFFAADKRYADKYNHGNRETPGFWLGFSRPYDMLEGGQRPFLLESEAIRYMRSIDAQPSFKNFPNKPFEILGNIWGDLSYLKDPKIMSIITKDPNKMTAAELADRTRILSKIRAGQHNDRVAGFGRLVDGKIKSGEWHPLRSTHYDGYIGRDHSLRWSPEYDPMEPFGSHPESYVITKPEQASILIGNNGSFNGPVYSRKYGGKFKFKGK